MSSNHFSTIRNSLLDKFEMQFKFASLWTGNQLTVLEIRRIVIMQVVPAEWNLTETFAANPIQVLRRCSLNKCPLTKRKIRAAYRIPSITRPSPASLCPPPNCTHYKITSRREFKWQNRASAQKARVITTHSIHVCGDDCGFSSLCLSAV